MANHRVKLLSPLDALHCEAKTLTKFREGTSEADKLCSVEAKYCVNGKNYCTTHAGKACLHALIDDSYLELK